MAQQLDRFLEECFHPRRGRAELRSIAPNTRRAREHLDKAHKNLRAMQLLRQLRSVQFQIGLDNQRPASLAPYHLQVELHLV